MKFLCLVAAILAVASAASIPEGKVRYDNHAVYRLIIKNEAQLAVMDVIKDITTDKYNIWKDYDEAGKDIHVMVNPDEVKSFKKLLDIYGIKTEVLIPNVQELIDGEQVDSRSGDALTMDWTRYYSFAEIYEWLDGIEAAYPQQVQGFNIGKSYEGRNIRGIKISYKSGNPGIFIESNIHAREWITSATATWFINQLLTSTKPEIRDLAENYDWYIIPVFNVDGFVYSHEKDRMWRKTRQPVSTSKCIGADANRNFNSHWMENGGASKDPCSETFAGSAPFSEPEADALAKYVASVKGKINMYLSFHSYGQYLLSPYGHSKTEFPDNYQDILIVGKAFSDAISGLSYSTAYKYGSTATVLYVASGSTVDWVFNTLDVKLGYTIEYRDQGRYGFVLPPVQILPNCEELMSGMLALVNSAKNLNYMAPKY